MLPILKREFIDSFKSIRTILIILFITIVSYQSAVLVDENRDLVNSLLEDGVEIGSVYTVAITMIILLLGFLFTFAISHDLINKEIELKTIRLLVTKVSRFEIVMGKLLGSFLFWVLVISASYGIIFIFSHQFMLKDFFQTLIFIFYMVSFVLFISTLVPKPKLTMFLGIILGLVMPIIGMIAFVSDKWYWQIIHSIMPYKYLDAAPAMMLIPFGVGVVYVLIALVVMQRRDF